MLEKIPRVEPINIDSLRSEFKNINSAFIIVLIHVDETIALHNELLADKNKPQNNLQARIYKQLIENEVKDLAEIGNTILNLSSTVEILKNSLNSLKNVDEESVQWFSGKLEKFKESVASMSSARELMLVDYKSVLGTLNADAN
jgi:hypothetical protein